MAARTLPNPRRKLGIVLAAAGIAVWVVGAFLYIGNITGLKPTIPYAGFVTTSVGGLLVAVGVSFVRGIPALASLEKRRTSLVIVFPGLVLFSLVLLCAALVFVENFEQQATALRWIGSTVFLLFSIAIVSALFRDVVLRFDRTESARSGLGGAS